MKYVMVIDLGQCVGCDGCTVACKLDNQTGSGIQWGRVIEEESGKFPDGKEALYSDSLHALRRVRMPQSLPHECHLSGRSRPGLDRLRQVHGLQVLHGRLSLYGADILTRPESLRGACPQTPRAKRAKASSRNAIFAKTGLRPAACRVAWKRVRMRPGSSVISITRTAESRG